MEDFLVWIPGAPQAKGRPRFRVFGGHVQTYTPKSTQMYEQLIAEQIRKAYPDYKTYVGPVELRLEFRMPVPKSNLTKFRYHAAECEKALAQPFGDLRVGSPAMLDQDLWKPCRVCKPSAVVFWSEQYHMKKPDLDNLEKSIMDGLQKSGVIVDDSQVVSKISSKAYSSKPGVYLQMAAAS